MPLFLNHRCIQNNHKIPILFYLQNRDQNLMFFWKARRKHFWSALGGKMEGFDAEIIQNGAKNETRMAPQTGAQIEVFFLTLLQESSVSFSMHFRIDVCTQVFEFLLLLQTATCKNSVLLVVCGDDFQSMHFFLRVAEKHEFSSAFRNENRSKIYRNCHQNFGAKINENLNRNCEHFG